MPFVYWSERYGRMNVWIALPPPVVFWFFFLVGLLVFLMRLSLECMNTWKTKRPQKNVYYQGILRWREIWPVWRSSVASRFISTKSRDLNLSNPGTCASQANAVTSYVTSRFNNFVFLNVIYILHQVILYQSCSADFSTHLLAAGTSGSVLLSIACSWVLFLLHWETAFIVSSNKKLNSEACYYRVRYNEGQYDSVQTYRMSLSLAWRPVLKCTNKKNFVV